jgi:hypothetical protein
MCGGFCRAASIWWLCETATPIVVVFVISSPTTQVNIDLEIIFHGVVGWWIIYLSYSFVSPFFLIGQINMYIYD